MTTERNVEERRIAIAPFHFVLAGEIPAGGMAIKSDDVYVYGKRVGTLLRIEVHAGGWVPTLVYLGKREENDA